MHFTIKLCLFALWSALLFIGGLGFREYQLLSKAFVTSKPLTLDTIVPGGENGRLPAGVTLYAYGGPDEQPTFVLLVGTKAFDALNESVPQHFLEKSPVSAMSE